MDFSLSQEQEAIRELARRILSEAGETDPADLRALEEGEWFDRPLWSALAEAQLPALALPASLGGAGLGMVEIALVLEEVGRHLARVPAWATFLLGGLPIAEFGSEAQRERWLAPVVREGAVLTAALEETGSGDPARPRTTARREGSGWRIDGVKTCVPAASLASCILVAAGVEGGGVGVFALEPRGEGVSIGIQRTTNREPHGLLVLEDARVDDDALLGDPGIGASIVRWILERARTGLAAMQVGVAEEALRRTAEYVSQRKQFGRPIATFQGVALRAADAYIDVQAMRATCTEAAWRLSAGLPAAEAVASAKWWACRGGERVVHTAQHLHGGIGADVDYPIHRYLLWAKQIEIALGGASEQLAALGALIVGDAPAETP